MNRLFPILLMLCSASHALALESPPGAPGSATPQPYENPAMRPLPAPAATPVPRPPLLPELPPARPNAPAPRLPQLQQQERERDQRRPADEAGGLRP